MLMHSSGRMLPLRLRLWMLWPLRLKGLRRCMLVEVASWLRILPCCSCSCSWTLLLLLRLPRRTPSAIVPGLRTVAMRVRRSSLLLVRASSLRRRLALFVSHSPAARSVLLLLRMRASMLPLLSLLRLLLSMLMAVRMSVRCGV